MLEKVIKYFRKPAVSLEDGRVALERDYEIHPTMENFKLPLSRNVIKQTIRNKYDFIEFVNEYKNDQTKIFYTDKDVQAVFNYPTVDKADYADSYCIMPIVRTVDVYKLLDSLDRDLSQKGFIRLLKRLEPYITSFDGKNVDDMDIIELAENLQATTNVNSIQRNTGKSFTLDVEVRSGNSNITIPRYITFEIPLFQNDIALKARFDVELFLEIKESEFVINLVCYKTDQTIEETLREFITQIQNGCNGVESFQV